MEFDKQLIERSLRIWNFNMDKISIESIQHVPMHEWRISNGEKTQLYIENLQCCVGLYAYGNGFSFAAHVNTIVFDKEEYILDERKKPVFCNRCNDLYEQILRYNGKIIEPFKIGISLGVTPLNDNERSMILIYKGIYQIINKLVNLGIPAIKLETIYEPELIVDALNNRIITPTKKEKTIKLIKKDKRFCLS